MAIKLFGFTLGKKEQAKEPPKGQSSFALPNEALDDGAVTVTNNAYYGTYVDLEGSVRNELELITRYREMANHPELDGAIDDIVNEAITHDVDGKSVDINLDNLKAGTYLGKYPTIVKDTLEMVRKRYMNDQTCNVFDRIIYQSSHRCNSIILGHYDIVTVIRNNLERYKYYGKN